MTPAELRDLFDDESDLHRMTSSAPPVTQNMLEHHRPDGSVWYEVFPEEDPPDRIGQNMSAEMVGLIGGVIGVHDSTLCPDCRRNPLLAEQRTSYGPRHPFRRAMQEWERMCRRRHRPGPSLQWRDHLNGPLCSDLLRAAASGVSLRWCSETWQVPYPRAERLLLSGLRFVAERYARSQDDQLGIVHDRDRCPVCREEEQA